MTTGGYLDSRQLQTNTLRVGSAASGDQNVRALQNDLRPVPDRIKFYPLAGFSFDARNASARDNFNFFLTSHVV